MGKIHEALQRAEEQRARLGGAPGGRSVPREVLDSIPEPRLRRGRSKRTARSRDMREGRRARVVLSDTDTAVSEQYRSLRARIQSIRRTRPIRSIVISSALPDEGKTTTAVNMALSFGLDLELKTCLIDADLRTPGVHRSLSEEPEAGLAEVLQEDAKFHDSLLYIPNTNLAVLSVRALPPNPAELIGSRRMSLLLEEAQSRFDTVLLDAPPILGVPDTTTLVDLCDAVILVVARGRSSRNDIENALERIDPSKVIGSVFNRCSEVPQPYGSSEGRGRR